MVLRRTSLIVFILTMPLAMTAAFYFATVYFLRATDRTIDGKVLFYAAAVEFAAFFFVAVLEVRDRW